jgi:glutaredoxin
LLYDADIMPENLPRLYSQDGCPYCTQVRDWLCRHAIAFTERNVTCNVQFAMELVATGLFATPLLIVGDQQLFEYRPDRLAALLGQ